MAEEVFAESRLAAEGWLRRDAVLAAVRAPDTDPAIVRQLWYALVTELWLARHDPAGARATPPARRSARPVAT
jgi:hypothetical protein